MSYLNITNWNHAGDLSDSDADIQGRRNEDAYSTDSSANTDRVNSAPSTSISPSCEHDFNFNKASLAPQWQSL